MCPESVSLDHLVLVCHCSVININTVQSQTHSLTGLKGAVKKARESKLLTAVCAAQAEQPQKGLRGSLCTRQGGGRREGLRGLFLHMEGLPGWVWVHSHSLGWIQNIKATDMTWTPPVLWCCWSRGQTQCVVLYGWWWWMAAHTRHCALLSPGFRC